VALGGLEKFGARAGVLYGDLRRTRPAFAQLTSVSTRKWEFSSFACLYTSRMCHESPKSASGVASDSSQSIVQSPKIGAIHGNGQKQ
jgi:hypothetical protein